MYFDVDYKEKQQDWREFENNTAKVFSEFGYKIKHNINFRDGRKFQIDIIAEDESRVIFVDCKLHKYISPSEEEKFIKDQIERALHYFNLKDSLKYKKAFALVVTKYKTTSNIMKTKPIMSVSFDDLPYLLRDIDKYEDLLFRVNLDS